MKLYCSPGSCSLSPHIVLEESGLKYEWEKIDPKTKMVSSGDYLKISPKGQVPALQLDNGQVLTEGSAVVQYIADQVPEKNLIPKMGTWERYRAIEWLNYVATEVHKGFGPMFYGGRVFADDEKAKQKLDAFATTALDKKMNWLSEVIKPNTFLMGAQFTVADAYLFTCLGWAKNVKYDLSRFPAILGYLEKVQNRPAVQKVMRDEGLLG